MGVVAAAHKHIAALGCEPTGVLVARRARKAMSSMTAGVTRPPTLRMTGASPSSSPRTTAGSTG